MVIDYARERRERSLDELKQLLRIPSISTLPEHREDMLSAAGWIRDKLASLGLGAELIRGEGHPLVYAEWLAAPGAPTVLAYGHYDVQPPDPLDLWTTPPFEPAVRDGNVYARGASDDKGQTMTMILAAEALMQTDGSLPVNLKFLIEGEEEAGGRAVTAFVHEQSDRLRADVAQVADTSLFAPGVPTLETGLRGNVFTEITARGASHDLHSGLYGGVAPNPLNALAHIIAGLRDAHGTITIPGFYDDVRMPDEEIRRSWRRLPLDEERLLREEIGAIALVGEEGFTALERIWARPTLDVHGIPGGYTGAGSKTVIPAEAGAKISMRIVPDQRADRIFELYSEHVGRLAPPGVTIDIHLHGASDPVLVAEDSPYIQAARRALRETFDREAVLGRSGGSIPIVGVFKASLGLDTVLMGWGLPDDNLHAPNEKLSLENFYLGTEATIRFWQELGTLGRA